MSEPLPVVFSMLSMSAGQVTGAVTNARAVIARLARDTSLSLTVLCNRDSVERVEDLDLPSGTIEIVAERAPATAGPRRIASLVTRLGPLGHTAHGKGLIHYPLTLNIPPTRGPRVMTLHDLAYRDLPSTFSRGQRLWRSHTYDRAAKRATFVITDSEHARGRIVDVLGVPPERVQAIHFAVDHERFSPHDPGTTIAACTRSGFRSGSSTTRRRSGRTRTMIAWSRRSGGIPRTRSRSA